MRRLFPALLMLLLSSFGAQSADQTEELTCNNIVKAEDTAETITSRYKNEAAIEEISGAEGETAKVLTLFGKDASRKLNISFMDDDMTKLSAIGPAEGATHWTVAGLTLGSPLADVVKANGGKFEISGFEWDYGGYVTDLKGGRLSAIEGGCMMMIRFNPPEGQDIPASLLGERSVSSSDAKLARLNPHVSDIQLGWANEDSGGNSPD